jgi:hypothetical protein
MEHVEDTTIHVGMHVKFERILGKEYISLWLRSHFLCNRVLLSTWFLHNYEWNTLHIVQVVTYTLTIDFELTCTQRAPLWFWSHSLLRKKNEWLY